MKAFAMLGLDRVGWIEKPRPECGPLDAIVRPITVSPCTSDVHTVFEGALGDRRDMILGHEAVGEVVEVGALVRDFRPGDRVIVTAITPDWGSLEAQRGYAMHSGGMLAGWKFSNFKDGVFAEFFHVNEADANLAQFGLRAALPAQRKYAGCDRTAQHTGKQTEEEFSPSAGRFPCRLFGRLFWCQNLHNRLDRQRLLGRCPTAAAETCFRLQFTAA